MYLEDLWEVVVVKRVSKRQLKLKQVRVLGRIQCTPEYAYELSFKRNDILIRPAPRRKVTVH
jgi:hypothetical protein